MTRIKCNTCSYHCEKCDMETEKDNHYKTDSLCWCCARAVPSGDIEECDWCKNKTPVYGWKAHKHKLSDGSIGYKVVLCPLFVKG